MFHVLDAVLDVALKVVLEAELKNRTSLEDVRSLQLDLVQSLEDVKSRDLCVNSVFPLYLVDELTSHPMHQFCFPTNVGGVQR